ncbi:MAG: MJ0042-type zinc finger domain-containing protein [Planctomycetota bacterium]
MPQSMQCPRCRAKIAVADDAGGSRVRCPKCEHDFYVPGGASQQGDDDDWLNLDEPITSPTPNSGNASGDANANEAQQPKPGATEDDWAGLDLPEMKEVAAAFPVPSQPKPARPSPTQTPAGGSGASKSQGAASSSSEPDAATEPIARNVEYETHYRVRCNICESPIDVRAEQAGRTIVCHDCHAKIKVPPPPKKKVKASIDLDRAETFQFSEEGDFPSERPADPFRRSAAELLADAEQAEVEDQPTNYDTPKIMEWLGSTLGIFTQLGVATQWLILSGLGGTAAFLAVGIGNPILIVALFPAGILFGSLVIAHGFVILTAIANGERKIDHWPVILQPMDWLMDSFMCLAAVALSGGPGSFIGTFTFGPSLATVCITMISLFLLFPFVLLSMMDSGNVFVPFSAEVSRSVTRCEEAWGGTYFSSAVLFFAIFMVFFVSSLLPPPVSAVIAVFVSVSGTFLYFAMVGRLAYSIGQSANAPPRENDIEQIRQAERETGQASS